MPNGEPLPEVTRRMMENKFGADFSEVRIHTAPSASARAIGVDANAYTFNNDIHFKPGTYDPYSPRGQEIIAHELAHVIQDNSIGARGL
jgi:uncharacterized protein DUF4157